MVTIYPSLSAAKDHVQQDALISQLNSVVAGFHCDVMDGNFVPYAGLSVERVNEINKLTVLPLFVHLMVGHPVVYITELTCKKKSIIAWHIEIVIPHLEIINLVHTKGWQAALVINPETPVDLALPFLPFCDVITLMSVQPGKSGQQYIPATTERIKHLHHLIKLTGSNCHIAVDGGVNPTTATDAIQAGATMLVMGSALVEATQPLAVIRSITDK